MGCMMSFFKNKKAWDKPFSEKVARRVSRVPTGDIEQWTDQSLYEIGRCLSHYAKTRDERYVEEALTGAEVLHAMVNELHTRVTRR